MEIPYEVLLLAIAIIGIVLVIIMISLWVKLSKLRKNYTALLNGNTQMNIEEVLIDLQSKWNEQAEWSREAGKSIEAIRKDMTRQKSNVGIYRYNAFGEGGSDLSFSIAIVDDFRNGLVLSGIHGRDQTYVYAKPLEEGQSKYTLSPEEKEAISRAGAAK